MQVVFDMFCWCHIRTHTHTLSLSISLFPLLSDRDIYYMLPYKDIPGVRFNMKIFNNSSFCCPVKSWPQNFNFIFYDPGRKRSGLVYIPEALGFMEQTLALWKLPSNDPFSGATSGQVVASCQWAIPIRGGGILLRAHWDFQSIASRPSISNKLIASSAKMNGLNVPFYFLV